MIFMKEVLEAEWGWGKNMGLGGGVGVLIPPQGKPISPPGGQDSHPDKEKLELDSAG